MTRPATTRAWQPLFEPGPPAFHLAAMDTAVFSTILDELAVAHPDAVIAPLSGEASRTQTGLFNELRRALRIPYESISWNVLNEAVHDLTWMPGDAYVLAVGAGHLLLSDAQPAALEILGQILGSADEGNLSLGRTLAPRHVLLQAPSSEAEALTSRLVAADIAFDRLP